MRHLLAGGGGFIGSHLTDLFLDRGDEVVVIDNFATGRRSNIAHLAGHERFTLIEHDITTTLPVFDTRFDTVLDLASPASPTDFATMPLEILAVGSTGTRNLLDLATASRRAILPGVDQRGLRRSAGAPATGNLLGQRQLDRAAQLLRRGQAVQRSDHHGLPPRPRPRRAHRPDLQHLRRTDAARRRSGRQHDGRAGVARRADHVARRRLADAQLLSTSPTRSSG